MEAGRQRRDRTSALLRAGQGPPHWILEFGHGRLLLVGSSTGSSRSSHCRRAGPEPGTARCRRPAPRPLKRWPVVQAITRNRADTLLDGPLAHPVEQGTFNPKVARSRLARPTSSEAVFGLLVPCG